MRIQQEGKCKRELCLQLNTEILVTVFAWTRSERFGFGRRVLLMPDIDT